jgi:AAA family ATPase
LAAKAHGYVGADLNAVVREAGTIAIKNWMASKLSDPSAPEDNLLLTLADLDAALPTVRPSAMRSLFVDTPPVRFAEIGGQGHVIRKLREVVEWPLLHAATFQRLGIKPPKGILLYGPPGCSKTVLARACATESGVNFIAVKGPEVNSFSYYFSALLSMFGISSFLPSSSENRNAPSVKSSVKREQPLPPSFYLYVTSFF